MNDPASARPPQETIATPSSSAGSAPARRVAFVMEQTLGNITHYKNLVGQQETASGIEPRWLPIDFSEGRLPWTVRGGLRARKALKQELAEVQGAFIHTTTLALCSFDQWRRLPTILSTDGTPASKRNMRAAYGLGAQNSLLEKGKQSLYRRLFGSAAGFVAWSPWVRDSLVEDYGCRPADVAVIPPGIQLADFAPGDRSHELPRILFVGGDFIRKGGDLVLDAFRKRLRGRAELILVTKAPIPEEPSVRVFRNLAANSPELRELYATSDIFTMPTTADCYALVCMEALAAGLPQVITRVGGLADLVQDGKTGYLVPSGDAPALGDALESLVTNPSLRASMSRAAREDGVRRFDARTNARRLFEFVLSRV